MRSLTSQGADALVAVEVDRMLVKAAGEVGCHLTCRNYGHAGRAE